MRTTFRRALRFAAHPVRTGQMPSITCENRQGNQNILRLENFASVKLTADAVFENTPSAENCGVFMEPGPGAEGEAKSRRRSQEPRAERRADAEARSRGGSEAAVAVASWNLRL